MLARVERDGTERRDFPLARRGSDRAAVDARLRAAAEELAALHGRPAALSGPQPAAQLEQAAAQMTSRLEALQGELERLLGALERSGDGLEERLARQRARADRVDEAGA